MAIYKYYPNTVFVNVFPSQEFGALTLLQWTELEEYNVAFNSAHYKETKQEIWIIPNWTDLICLKILTP